MTLTTSIPLFIHAGDQVTVDGKTFVVVRLISTNVLKVRNARWFDFIIPTIKAWMRKWDQRFASRYYDRDDARGEWL